MYRITYEGPDDKLRGLILCKDEENGFQYLYKYENMEDVDVDNIMLKYNTFESYKDADKQLKLIDDPLFKDSDHIIPNTRIQSSIRAKNGFLLKFYMFGVVYQDVSIEFPDRPWDFSAPLRTTILSNDGFRYLTVFYAIFKNAVEARVKVMLNNNSVSFGLYGLLSARTNVIEYPAYSSLIFCKHPFEKIQIGQGDNVIIPLSRDIVAVPLGHQLILEFSLHEEDEDNDKMVEDLLIFGARKDGTSTRSIRCNKGELKVEVTWRSTRERAEALAN